MAFELIALLNICLGFTTYFFWYNNKGLLQIPLVSRICGVLFLICTIWIGVAIRSQPIIESVSIHPIKKVQLSDGIVSDVVQLDDELINLNSKFGGSLPANAKVKLIIFKNASFGIVFHREKKISLLP